MAFGYPMCNIHSYKKDIFYLTNAKERIGVDLTENYAIVPTTSICGLIIAHPNAKYFGVVNRF